MHILRLKRAFTSNLNKLKLAAIAAFAIVAGSVIATMPANAAVANWQKGISIQSRYNTDFASDSFKQSVRNAKADGVNFIMLVVSVHQDNIYSSSVYAGGDTPTDSALASGLSYVKSQGMNVGIALHDDPYDGQWRAYINPSDTITWFNTYNSLLTRYAAIGQANGASEIIIGTELSTMTRSANTSRWLSVIKNVRSVFSGQLTYSAQHYGYMGDASQVGFWSALDYIGLSAYYSLGTNTSQSSMESAWKNWDNTEVSSLASKYGKQVIFTEVGYVSRDGGTNDPGDGYTLNTATNTTLQATAYSALFNYWNNSSVLAGTFLWDWSSDPNAGGNGDNGYTPQNKPAEAVMKQWYTKSGSGSTGTGGGSTTPTTPATYTTSLTGTTTATVGTATTNAVAVSASSTQNNMLVDIEIYDASGNRVAQTVYDNKTLSTTAQTFSLGWTPSSAGTYTVKVGVFTSGWTSNPYWNNGLGTITASAPATTPPNNGGSTGSGSTGGNSGNTGTGGTSTGGSATTTPGSGSGTGTGTGGAGGSTTPPTQPTNPTQPTQPTNPSTPLTTGMTVWWPGNGTAVSGVQPFKALIDNRDVTTYNMYWQVDGGQLNLMGNNSDPIAHKESSVNLSGWNWNASHNYVITFVAKDLNGVVINQSSVTITIN